MTISIANRIENNVAHLLQVFDGCDDLSVLPWQFGPQMKLRAVSVYFDTIILDNRSNYFKQTLQDIVTHEVGAGTEVTLEMVTGYFSNHVASSGRGFLVQNFSQLESALLSGSVVVMVDGWNQAICYLANGLDTRSVSEPVTEPVVQGPRESTVENMKKNIGMIRNRVRSADVKFTFIKTGGHAHTTVAYGYIEGVVSTEVLGEFKKRIAVIPEGTVLETSYIESCIESHRWSPFPQFRYTERTDVAAAELLNGKIIVLVEGTGSVLICPALFIELLQSSEDYYQRTLIANTIRGMRLLAFLMALVLPSIYIAVSTFHSELIPTVLLLAIIDTREGIPFPALTEAVIMVFIFELLREAGIRLPRPVGSAVSIVGALVVGEAAINAGIASPFMVVVTALTGIASFSLPQYNFAFSLRLLQLPLMLLASMLGGFGLMIGYLLVWNHLVRIKSLGVPYLTPFAPWVPGQLRDSLFRTPLTNLMKQTKPPAGR